MTLEEAIKHCEEVAKENRELADKIGVSKYDDVDCVKCAKAHEQLAEWLKELKRQREAWKKVKTEIEQMYALYKFNYQGFSMNIVADCLAIIDKHLQEVKTDADSD